MSLIRRWPLALLILVCAAVHAADVIGLRALRCEYLVDPLGLDETQPRLSWVMESPRRGAKQTAYQILVASNRSRLDADQGDWWDSGRVASDASAQVVYGGKPLTSRAACYWKVRVWDQDGKPSAYSAPARWEMGLLLPNDWSASWIESAGQSAGMFPANAAWIWHHDNDNLIAGAPAGARWLRCTFQVPAGTVARASLAMAVDDQSTVYLDGREVMKTSAWNIPQRIELPGLAAGDHLLAVAANNGAGPAGVLCRLVVEFADGKRMELVSDTSWKTAATSADGWEKPGFDDTGWSAAAVVAPFGQGPWGAIGAAPAPVPYLRKALTVAKPVASARLYATALGLYELRLNGQRVGDHILAPEWTDYRKRVRYTAYDVTALIKPGANAIAALLGNGWYSGHIGNGGYQFYGKVPALFAQLEITYGDGSSERIVTDASWKAHASPVLSSDFMLGENYDARLEIAGWDAPGLDDAGWSAVTVRDEAPRPLQGQVTQPVRVTAELKAKAVSEPAPGRWTFDLGQNLVGVVRLNVSAPAGTQLTLRHAEMLNPDGTLYTANLRGAPSVDTYICKGAGAEIWQPRFTFHGFRYVELNGLPGKPGGEAVTALVLGSDTPRTGEFACSDPRLNQLQSNIQWGQRGNYLSVPTDCPQRDERLGWMGDAEVFVRTATGNADVAAFFSKWLVDVDDAQWPDGQFTDVSPDTMHCANVPAWGDAGVICPWTIYLAYGDTRVLERHLPAMEKWVEWMRAHSTGLIRDKDRGNDYGDWLSIGADTPKDVIGTAFFAHSTHLVALAAKAIGRNDDAAKYQQLFADIKSAFNQRYVAADGRIHGNTQCCYAMALKFELLPEELRAKAEQYLEDDIKARGGHLSTGFVGVSYLLPVLTRAGKLDTAFRLLTQDSFPSWLFSVKHGATTIWERWDGWTPEKGFQDAGMNSFNHYSLGSCGEWMYDSLAGIGLDAQQPGYRHIIIHPHAGGGITSAHGAMETIHGRIVSDWKLDSGSFILACTIPANTSATVFVPASALTAVSEAGKPAAHAEGVGAARQEGGEAVFEIGAGTYRFIAK